MAETANSSKTVKPWQFKRGTSGNPSGRPKGLAAASALIQSEAARLAKQRHPKAEEISQRMGFKVRTMLEVTLLEMMEDDPRTFLAYLGGKPRESVDLTTNSLPDVINVRFANDFDPDEDQPPDASPPSARL